MLAGDVGVGCRWTMKNWLGIWMQGKVELGSGDFSMCRSFNIPSCWLQLFFKDHCTHCLPSVWVFFIFFVFFSLLISFPGTLLCCPSLWPPLSAPQPCKCFFLFLFAYTLIFKGCPSPATCHVNPTPPTSSSSIDAMPLHCVNTPGIGLG